MLQIRLTIKILSLNIADTFAAGRAKQNQISWEELVACYLDDHAYLHLLPRFGLKLVSGGVKNKTFTVVFLVISSMPFDIFEQIFHS